MDPSPRGKPYGNVTWLSYFSPDWNLGGFNKKLATRMQNGTKPLQDQVNDPRQTWIVYLRRWSSASVTGIQSDVESYVGL